jgi:hypothetical protein
MEENLSIEAFFSITEHPSWETHEGNILSQLSVWKRSWIAHNQHRPKARE